MKVSEWLKKRGAERLGTVREQGQKVAWEGFLCLGVEVGGRHVNPGVGGWLPCLEPLGSQVSFCRLSQAVCLGLEHCQRQRLNHKLGAYWAMKWHMGKADLRLSPKAISAPSASPQHTGDKSRHVPGRVPTAE